MGKQKSSMENMVKSKFYIPFAKASVSPQDIKTVNNAVKYGWGKNCNNYIHKFEKKFSNYIKKKYAIATSSCTGALHLALRSININPGDEVIVPEITWIGSVAPIIYEKATPIFVDINKDDWCIDTKKIEKKISKRTKAIIAVHLYGNIANIKELKKISKKYKLYLIEDTAEALGSKINNKLAGSFGDISVFSFHGTKTLTTGEGGMFLTNNRRIYEKAIIQSNHGRKPSKHSIFWMDQIGLKYKISNLQAALGYSQLNRINKIIKKKIQIFKFYKKYLGKYGCMNVEKKGLINSAWLPAIIFDKKFINPKKRNQLIDEAQRQGIGLRPFFFPVSIFPMFKKNFENKSSMEIYKYGINLPSFEKITKIELKIVVDFIKKGLNLS